MLGLCSRKKQEPCNTLKRQTCFHLHIQICELEMHGAECLEKCEEATAGIECGNQNVNWSGS